MKNGKNDTRQKLGAVLGDSELSAAAKLIYCALFDASSSVQPRAPGEKDLEPGQVAATHKELARMIGMNVKTIPKALEALKKRELIRMLKRNQYYGCGFQERVYEIVHDQNPPCDEKSILRVPRLLRGALRFLHGALELDHDLSKFKVKDLGFFELQSWLDAVASDYEKNGPRARALKSIDEELKMQFHPDRQ